MGIKTTPIKMLLRTSKIALWDKRRLPRGPGDLTHGGKDLTPERCPLTSSRILWHTGTHGLRHIHR